MSVVSVKPKDFILALFIRDDNERFLLGDNGYDFMDSQLHFAANTIENDEVEKQGADGTMLAGQVRRASVQTFDGYVGDATTPKETIEEMRRAFIAFFLKGHHYRVVYVDTARNAWLRKGGYLVDAPEVKELFQIHPEYHVGLNFEDVNYYSYDENADGDEITANLVEVAISSAVEGGLIWDNNGAVSDDATFSYIAETAQASGKNIVIEDATNASLISLQIDGETSQQTYTGKNLLNLGPKSDGGVSGAIANGSTITVTGTALATDGKSVAGLLTTLQAGTYTFTIDHAATHVINFTVNTSGGSVAFRLAAGETSITKTLASASTGGNVFWAITQGQTYNETFKLQLVAGSTPDYDYEPYVGGTASPNPDYPQAVNVVTGENMLTISDGQGSEQSYEVNLGKNLFEVQDATGTRGNNTVVASGQTITLNSNTSGTETAFYLNDVSQISQYLASSYSTARDYKMAGPGGSYTLTIALENIPSGTGALVWDIYTNKRTLQYARSDIVDGKIIKTIVLSDDEYFKSVQFYTSSTSVFSDFAMTVQLEKGSQATSYAAYFEPIELCKIGTYQDSIYKSGDKWYVHKETDKVVLTGSESYTTRSNTTPNYPKYRLNANVLSGNIASATSLVCPYFIANVGANSSNYEGEAICGSETVGYEKQLWFSIKSTTASSLNNFKTWVQNNSPAVYYALATSPTDTEITNAALIAQLEAVLSQGHTYAGTNNIALIPSGNEQGSLEITYYTKYIVNITAGGYEWEQGGSGGPTVIMNDSIDYVYPIWTITGPITNPVLENTTTGEQIEYVGTIGEGQTLVIDMGEQTALLDGLNVLSSVAGEFISLAPGANTLLYSASSGNEPSEIGWSEIVG